MRKFSCAYSAVKPAYPSSTFAEIMRPPTLDSPQCPARYERQRGIEGKDHATATQTHPYTHDLRNYRRSEEPANRGGMIMTGNLVRHLTIAALALLAIPALAPLSGAPEC
jgi:hypothetical protein